jgi:drug/metabolite transporter (DMT)-like permease
MTARPLRVDSVDPSRDAREGLPVAVLLFSASMWGLAWWPLKAFAAEGLSGPLLALLTYGAVGMVGLPWLWRERAGWRPETRWLLLIAILGGWGNAAFVSAMVLGDVVRVMLLFYLAPVWSVLGGRVFLGEAVSRRRGAAVVLALAGAFLVVGGFKAFDSPLSAADLLALSAGMGFAGNNVVSRAAQAISTVSKTVSLCIGCGLIALLMLVVAGPPSAAWPAPTLPLGVALVAYSFGGLLLVTATWQWSVTRLEAGRSGVIAIAELGVALVTASLIGGERLTPHEWLGGALIMAAALLEATDTATPSPSHRTEESA